MRAYILLQRVASGLFLVSSLDALRGGECAEPYRMTSPSTLPAFEHVHRRVDDRGVIGNPRD